jgi:hypothetical protein
MCDRLPCLLRYLIWVWIFLAVSCAATRPATALQFRNAPDVASDQSSSAETFTLSGMVVDAVTGAPIPRALVQLFVQQPQLVLTDEGGKFQFENLTQGAYAIHARKPGYAYIPGQFPTVVTIGANASPLLLKLEPESGIAVKVTGEDGEGAEDLPVRVFRSQVQEGRRFWETHGGGRTNEQGEFRAGDLPPGKYYVSVGPSFRPVGHSGEGAQERDLGYPRVFYPNTEELEAAAPVEVNARRRERLEFTLSTVPLYRISGAVVGGPPGQPCVVRLTDNSGEDMAIGFGANPITRVFRSGEIPAGFYTLVANCNPTAEVRLIGKMPVRVDSNIANLTLPVAQTVSIAVTFRTNGGGADANENIPSGQVLMMQKQSAARGIAAWSEPEKDGDDKRVVIKKVAPGTYSVEIRADVGWYVEAARYGSVDLLAEDLTVPEGGTAEAIEIVLRNDGAIVGGNVRQGGIATASGSVLLVPDHAPWLVKISQITNGTFAIGDLAPGSYHAIAVDRVDDLEYTNPEAMKDYLAKAQDVTLGPKQEAHIDLELLQREK